MLINSFIPEEDAMLQLGVLAWLIKKYGPSKKTKVPSPLHKPAKLAELCWESPDTHNLADWAQLNFDSIKQQCGMRDWPIQLALTSDDYKNSERRLVAQKWNTNSKEPYYIDNFGRPVILYNADLCTTAGYFPKRIITKLAEIKLMNFPLEEPVTPLQSKIMILAAACYMGQGFEMAGLLQNAPIKSLDLGVSARVGRKITDRGLIFATCALLLSQKLTPEQIVASYGMVMSKKFRKLVRPACKQAEGYETELTIIKILANPKHETFENNSFAIYA